MNKTDQNTQPPAEAELTQAVKEAPIDYLHRMQTLRDQCHIAQERAHGIEAYKHCSKVDHNYVRVTVESAEEEKT